jgi:hypothetical protein
VGLVVGHRAVPIHGDGETPRFHAVEAEAADLTVVDEPGTDAHVEEFDKLAGVQRVQKAHLANQSLAVAGKVDAEVGERQQDGPSEVAEFVHYPDGTQPT